MPALRADKHINVCQLREGDPLAAIGAGKCASGITLNVLAFRMYGRHGAIVARRDKAALARRFPSHGTGDKMLFQRAWQKHGGILSEKRRDWALSGWPAISFLLPRHPYRYG